MNTHSCLPRTHTQRAFNCTAHTPHTSKNTPPAALNRTRSFTTALQYLQGLRDKGSYPTVVITLALLLGHQNLPTQTNTQQERRTRSGKDAHVPPPLLSSSTD
jgi:hypothetical protein